VYALPDDFPGKAENIRNPADPTLYVNELQKAFEEDIGYYRFMAYLQLHEYETMLFADLDAFAFEDCKNQIEQLKEIAASEPSIEHINDGKETAPSKRIISVFPEYEGRKSTAGPDIAEYIGVEKICAKCPHVARWLDRLKTIPWEAEEGV
jgi:hypothetical protein